MSYIILHPFVPNPGDVGFLGLRASTCPKSQDMGKSLNFQWVFFLNFQEVIIFDKWNREHGRSPPGVQGIRGALSVENLKTTELSTSQSAIISIANSSQQRQ